MFSGQVLLKEGGVVSAKGKKTLNWNTYICTGIESNLFSLE